MRVSTPRRALALGTAAALLPLLPAGLALSPASAAPAAPAAAAGPAFTDVVPGALVAVRGKDLATTPGTGVRSLTKARASTARAPQANLQGRCDTGFEDIEVAGPLFVCFQGGIQAQRDAFIRAATTWGNRLASPVAIEVEVTLAPPAQGEEDVLGAAGPADLGALTGVPGAVPNTLYPVALANSLGRTDFNGGAPEIQAVFNNSPALFSFTPGGPPPCDPDISNNCLYDFETVALHEIAHGLGFIGGMSVFCGSAANPRRDAGGRLTCLPGDVARGGWDQYTAENDPGAPRMPFIFDRFAVRTSPAPASTLFALGQDSVALRQALTTGEIYFGGPHLTDLRPCSPVTARLYTPNEGFFEGSSYSHLDEDFFSTGSSNALMTPFIEPNEVLHEPGSIALAMMRQFGWATFKQPITDATTACAPATMVANSTTYLRGNAPAGKVTLFFRKRGQSGFSPLGTADVSATGSWASPFRATDDYMFYAQSNTTGAVSKVVLIRALPTVNGAKVVNVKRGARYNITGRGISNTVITLRFRLQSTTTAGYPIVRTARVNASGVWTYPINVTQDHAVYAVGVNGSRSTGTVTFRDV